MDSSPHYYMHRPSKYYADALLLLAVLVVLFCLNPSVFAGDLKSGTFVGLLEDGKKPPILVYSVLCDNEDRCKMTLDFSGDAISRPLEASNRLLLSVNTTLESVRAHSYPQKMDHEYKALDGFHATNCWNAGDPSGNGGLCRFSSEEGVIKWVVLWGDMCSASCYSGFVPLYVVKK